MHLADPVSEGADLRISGHSAYHRRYDSSEARIGLGHTQFSIIPIQDTLVRRKLNDAGDSLVSFLVEKTLSGPRRSGVLERMQPHRYVLDAANEIVG